MSRASPCVIAILCLCSGAAHASRQQGSKLLEDLRQVSQPGAAGAQKFLKIQESLKVAFTALPKNDEGRLAPNAVRHMLYNYFAGMNGILYRGLEHHGMASASLKHLHEVKIIQEKAPELTKSLLDARPVEYGLSLEEVAALASALEDLAHDTMVPVLNSAYLARNRSTESTLTRNQAEKVLQTYFIFYSRGLLDMTNNQYVEAWNQTSNNTREEATSLMNHAMKIVAYGSSNPFPADQFSYARVWDIAKWMGERHGHHQNTDCIEMKNILVGRDLSKMGRVPLKDFYEEGKHGKFNFNEGVDFLRSVGALDTSMPDDPKVVLANYVLGSWNCVADTKYNAACCINECVGLMSQVERQTQGPRALPEPLLGLVQNISSSTVDAPRRLPKVLIEKLESIAAQHGGEVPLHGRLFAQWLHFAFPNECPYPSVLKGATALNPSQPPRKADLATSSQIRDVKDGHRRWKALPEFMSQWNDEEMLPLDETWLSTKAHDESMSTLFQAMMYIFVVLGGIRCLRLSQIKAIRTFFCSAGAKSQDAEWWMEEDAKQASRLANGKAPNVTDMKARKGKVPEQKVSKPNDVPSKEKAEPKPKEAPEQKANKPKDVPSKEKAEPKSKEAPEQKASKPKDVPSKEKAEPKSKEASSAGPKQKQKTKPVIKAPAEMETSRTHKAGEQCPEAAKKKSKTVATASEIVSDVHVEAGDEIILAEEKIGQVMSDAFGKNMSEASTHVTQMSSLRSLPARQPESEPGSPGSSTPRSKEDEVVPVGMQEKVWAKPVGLQELEGADRSETLPGSTLGQEVLCPATQMAMMAERMADAMEAKDSPSSFKKEGPWKARRNLEDDRHTVSSNLLADEMQAQDSLSSFKKEGPWKARRNLEDDPHNRNLLADEMQAQDSLSSFKKEGPWKARTNLEDDRDKVSSNLLADAMEAKDSLASFKKEGPWKARQARRNEVAQNSASSRHTQHGMGGVAWQPPPDLRKQVSSDTACFVDACTEEAVAPTLPCDATQNFTDSVFPIEQPSLCNPSGLQMLAPPDPVFTGPPPGLQAIGPKTLPCPMTCNTSSSDDDPDLVAQIQIIADELKREREARERLEGIFAMRACCMTTMTLPGPNDM